MENIIAFGDFKKLDLRVAEVIEVQDHPSADKLYVMKISLGGQEKQIVAGIRKNYDKEALKGKKIIVVNNLEPATIRGEESNGMLLAAADGDAPVLLVPDRDVPSGVPIS
jgi:methionine--tRNA ligase beta chain